MSSFRKQLELFAAQLEEETLTHFPYCLKIWEEYPNIKFSVFREDVLQIMHEFNTRFSDFDNLNKSIRLFTSPLTANIKDQDETLQLELCTLQARSVF